MKNKNKHLSNASRNKLLQQLHNIQQNHRLWQTPFLKNMAANCYSIEEMRTIFSQYYWYSKNFTKLLAAAMLRCDNDYYRSKLSENLWEEGGGKEIEQRHAEIFKKFLENTLQIDLAEIKFNSETHYFVRQYLQLCLNKDPLVVFAALAFATEGIVSQLYTIFRSALLALGFDDQQLAFFNIHIECDDEHAATLCEMVFAYVHEKNWLSRCQKGMTKALNLRANFFDNLEDVLKQQRLKKFLADCQFNAWANSNPAIKQVKQNHLYQNKDTNRDIDFQVKRVATNSHVLDPRLVEIPPNNANEKHRHAHETVIYILQGCGQLLLNEHTCHFNANDILHIPRWSWHQIHNTGEEILKYFAVTDYWLTHRLLYAAEDSYRNQNTDNTNGGTHHVI